MNTNENWMSDIPEGLPKCYHGNSIFDWAKDKIYPSCGCGHYFHNKAYSEAQPLVELDEEKVIETIDNVFRENKYLCNKPNDGTINLIVREVCNKFGTKRELKREIKFPEKMTYDSDMTGWYIKYCEGWNGAIEACRKAYEDSLKEKE